MIFNAHYPYIGGGGSMPQFTYTGQYSFIDDGGGNWRIKFLSSGVFTTLKDMFVDEFLVAGGGAGGYKSGNYANASVCSGGGSGYTKTVKGVTLKAGELYSIVIGEGGTNGNDGGNTEAFGETVSGGKHGLFSESNSRKGGDGGSGGGAAAKVAVAIGADGGSDGSDGNSTSSISGGIGQGATTREFGEQTGDLYAGGGGGRNGNGNGKGGAGGGGDAYQDGTANTGGGGGAFSSGGSGIAIIRNAR